MIKKSAQALSHLNPLLVFGVMVLIVLLLAFEGWTLFLRKPYTEYKRVALEKVSLAAALGQYSDQSGEIVKLVGDLKQLADKLTGELHFPASDDQMTAPLIEALDQSAVLYGVTLVSVAPSERKPISVFEEISFEVTAKGGYLQLSKWMLEFDKTLGNSATVTSFDMKSADEGRQVILSLNIALYRPLNLNEVAK